MYADGDGVDGRDPQLENRPFTSVVGEQLLPTAGVMVRRGVNARARAILTLLAVDVGGRGTVAVKKLGSPSASPAPGTAKRPGSKGK
jgi:hypothetical protein